jgi:uncharacterized membrane protein YfcA
MNHKEALAELHTSLGHGKLSRAWAKLEILLGLASAGAGLFLGTRAASRPDVDWFEAAGGLLLLVLGGYLAMAGNRSHLYQSNNELTAYLASKLQ